MNVASLENCKELYELSGWDDTPFSYGKTKVYFGTAHRAGGYPAYDLGYLLRKLPSFTKVWLANTWWAENEKTGDGEHADTPEDAAAGLAIQLFKQGILTTDSKPEGV